MFYGIVVFPSKTVQEFANHYRRRYDTHFTLLPPHLTVREKEEWNQEQLEAAMAQLTQAAASVQPFNVTFNRFSSFYPVANVVYMALEDPEPMQRLHQHVCAGPLGEQAKPYVYTPHLTVAQDLSADEMHDVLASLRRKPLRLDTPIDTLALLRQEQDGSWSTLKEFPLG